jgi:hypothetical protein
MTTRLDDFAVFRQRMNERILAEDHLGIRRFFNLDTRAYEDGPLPGRTKELLGLVASTRCCAPSPYPRSSPVRSEQFPSCHRAPEPLPKLLPRLFGFECRSRSRFDRPASAGRSVQRNLPRRPVVPERSGRLGGPAPHHAAQSQMDRY